MCHQMGESPKAIKQRILRILCGLPNSAFNQGEVDFEGMYQGNDGGSGDAQNNRCHIFSVFVC